MKGSVVNVCVLRGKKSSLNDTHHELSDEEVDSTKIQGRGRKKLQGKLANKKPSYSLEMDVQGVFSGLCWSSPTMT